MRWAGRPEVFLQRPDHRVERIGDADDESVGRMRLDAGADRVHHLEIDAEQVVAAHAGLARHAGGDDDDVGAGDVGVGTGPRQLGVEAVDRRGFGEIERLALRNAVDDVEENDVAQFLQRGQMRQRAADLAGPDQSNLLTRHGLRPWFWPRFAQRAMAAAIVLSGCSFKPNFWRSAEYDRVICACAPVPPSPNTFGTYPKRRISAGSSIRRSPACGWISPREATLS